MAVKFRLLKLVAAVSVMAGGAGCTTAPEQLVPPPSAVLEAGPYQWLGSGSCASMGCHNANGLKGDKGSEYTTWIGHDKHARSYEVLSNLKSRAIAKNLGRGKPANEDALCLNCHVHRAYDEAKHHPRFGKEDGVGCESCHGPASGWVSEHYKTSWRELRTSQKVATGMSDTRSLEGRVRSCVPCHVGAGAMDVNHDLIAAGHPRLAFDFSAYHALMPHHWPVDHDKRTRPDWDAAAWFVGEAITTQAALDLLASRARGGIWPEFAEYDCYACHHQLQYKSWRKERGFPDRKPGNPPWNDWYISPLPYRVNPGKGDAQQLAQQIAGLKAVMESKIVPDCGEVTKQALAAAKTLEAWVTQFNKDRYTPEVLATCLMQLAKQEAPTQVGSWDEAAKTYLAVVAIYHAGGAKARRPEVIDALKAIRGVLRFDPDSDSPRRDYQPKDLLDPYKLLQQRLSSVEKGVEK
jgi:Cytochrome c554 and c-prime